VQVVKAAQFVSFLYHTRTQHGFARESTDKGI